MNPSSASEPASPIPALRRLARRPVEGELCEFCSVPLRTAHRHLLETASRKLVCACDGCALRFDSAIGRWKLLPRDSRRLGGFELTDAQWNSLGLPIELAFLFHNTLEGRTVAMYPSPAGATEATVSASSWAAILEDNPVLGAMQPDVEALLVNRLKETREYYLAPLDVCFELVGRIRLHWRGFSGGDRVWEEMEAFFSRLREICGEAVAQSVP